MLTPVGVSGTPLTRNFGFFDNRQTANGRLIIAALSALTTIRGEGNILEIQYQVNPGAQYGSSSTLSFPLVILVDEFTSAVAVDYSAKASMTVGPRMLLGDVYPDSSVNILDAVYLSEIIIGRRLPNNQQRQAGDINGDRLLDSADLVLLLRFIVSGSTLAPGDSPEAAVHRNAVTSDTIHHLSWGAPESRGSSVTLPLIISNLAGIAGTDIVINYDPEHLILNGITPGEIRTSYTLAHAESGQIRMVMGRGGITSGSGTVAYLAFTRRDYVETTLVVAKFKASGRNGENLARTESVTADDTQLFAGIPIETVDERRVSIRPSTGGGVSPAEIVALMPGPRGVYSRHRIEFPGYTFAELGTAIDVTIRQAQPLEREGGPGPAFPSRSSALFVVETATSAGMIAFRAPVNITVQFAPDSMKDFPREQWYDLVDLRNQDALARRMTMVTDGVDGAGVRFEYIPAARELDAVAGTITVRNYVGLTGASGMAAYGAVARSLASVRRWMMYR